MLKGVKLILIFSVVALFLLTSSLISIFSPTEKLRRLAQVYQTHHYSRWVLRILGIRLHSVNQPSFESIRESLVVANHLSYLDVIALSALFPSVFITSKEVEKSFLLGFLSKGAGALFVERRKRSRLNEEISSIQEVLNEGFSVTVFPEATTSPGREVLPFKHSFFDVAVRGEKKIIPICINYRKANGESITSVLRESLFYYGEMEFFSHLRRVTSLKSVEIELNFLDPLYSNRFSDRKELSAFSYSKIVSHYVPVV